MKSPNEPVIHAIFLSLLVLTTAGAGEPVDKGLIPEARTVLKVLESQYGKKTLSASTSDVAGWILESTGRQPAIVAFRKRYYPGDGYVDIAGIDIYPGSGYGRPNEDVYPKAFQIMQQVAPGKMLAMCESGTPINPVTVRRGRTYSTSLRSRNSAATRT